MFLFHMECLLGRGSGAGCLDRALPYLDGVALSGFLGLGRGGFVGGGWVFCSMWNVCWGAAVVPGADRALPYLGGVALSGLLGLGDEVL